MRRPEPPRASARAALTIAHCDAKLASLQSLIHPLVALLRGYRRAGPVADRRTTQRQGELRQQRNVRRAYRALRRASQRTKDMADGVIPMLTPRDPAEAIA